LDRKTDIQEYVVRKEAHLSHDLISHAFTATDIRHNSLSVVVDYQNAFDCTLNYNVLDIDGTAESPNQLLDARVIYISYK